MSNYKYKPLKLSIYDDNFKASNSHQNFDEKLTPLDTHSFNSDDVDDDVPLLKLDNPQQSQQSQAQSTQQYHQYDNMSNDSDSILLNLDNSDNQNNKNKQNNQNNIIKNNKQINIDILSRNIIRFYLMTIIVVSVILSIIIIGGIDYHNTDSDKILYGTVLILN